MKMKENRSIYIVFFKVCVKEVKIIYIQCVLFFSIVLLISQKQTLEELKHSVQQLRCTEAKFTAQKELLEQKVQENDGKEPPPVINYEEDARSVTSMVSQRVIK